MASPEIPHIAEFAALTIRAAALDDKAALCGFRAALFREISRLSEMVCDGIRDAFDDAAMRQAAVAEFKSQVWSRIFEKLEDISSGADESFPLPVATWRNEARKIGRATGEGIALHGRMSEREARRRAGAMGKAVRRRFKEVASDWPLSHAVRRALTDDLLSEAEEAAISVLSRSNPLQHATLN